MEGRAVELETKFCRSRTYRAGEDPREVSFCERG
jgi:hypothetical protein